MRIIAKHILLLALIILSLKPLSAQVYVPLGEGLPAPVELSHYQNETLFVIYQSDRPSIDSISFRVAQWENDQWSLFPEFTLVFEGASINYDIHCMEWFQGDLYVGGNFPAVAGINASSNLIKFDGTRWTDAGQGILPISKWTYVRDMEVFQKELYVAGNFNQAGNKNCLNIAKWDGSNWTPLGDGLNNIVNNLDVYKKRLYASGYFDFSGPEYTGPLAQWDGQSWQSIETPHQVIFLSGIHENKIFTYGKTATESEALYYWDGLNWEKTMDSFPEDHIFFNMAGSEKDLWACGHFTYENGSSYNIIKFNGSIWQPVLKSSKNHLISYATQVGQGVVFTGNFDSINNEAFHHIYHYKYELGDISGTIFYDKNNDCKPDPGDVPLNNRIIEIQPGNILINTDSTGQFRHKLPPGQYTVKHKSDYWNINPCNQDSYIVVVKRFESTKGLKFATYPSAYNKSDLKVQLHAVQGFRARQGFEEKYMIEFTNNGDRTINYGHVSLTHDPALEFIKSNPPVDSNWQNRLVWNFKQLQTAAEKEITLYFKIPVELTDTIIFNTTAYPLESDNNPDNNVYSLCQKGVGSFDPNDKQCFPEGYISRNTKNINYHIRFQNTGNNTAYRVRVIDTIDTEHLPIEEVILNSSSHPYELYVHENVISWHFNNILLPDSSTNCKASNGYISYSTKIREGLAEGDTIENRAYIYFDYQKAVPTNKTINIVNSSKVLPTDLDDDLWVYPNPANKYVTLHYSGAENLCKINLVNSLGQVVREVHLSPFQPKTINIQAYQSGLYYFISKDQKFKDKLLKLR